MGARHFGPFYTLLIMALTGLACEDDVSLRKVCPLPQPCAINSNGDIVKENLEPYAEGACKLGTLSCDPGGNEYCQGYVGPTEEICDGLDNNCDGISDEGYDADGDGYPYCQDCDDNNRYINPGEPERCNDIDDNCNQMVDEETFRDCWTGPIISVFGGTSSCKKGREECENGVWKNCIGEVLPGIEYCDGIDNNCNGQIDERQYNACGPSDFTGVCRKGDLICQESEQLCIGAVYPSGETCDGLDNDCDGLVDNGLFRPCTTSCGTGYESCSEGQWVNCTADAPAVEICDQEDNDCDGVVDEDCPCHLNQVSICRSNIVDQSGQPANCGFGITMCDSSGNWGPCYFFGTEPEVCNDWDDDCDGQIDGLTRSCGNPSTAGRGECRLGQQTCATGFWGGCVGEISPQAEICDQLDNDCDGLIDEDLNPHNKVDMVFAIDISGSMCSSINALKQGITAYISSFSGTDHRFGIVTFPGLAPSLPADVRTSPPLMAALGFENFLQTITCSGSGSEPSYDVAHMLSNSLDPLLIGWRPDAHPYIIIMTDENAQTWSNLTQAQIAPQMSNCSIGGCGPSDFIEVFILGPSFTVGQWDLITYGDPARFIDITPIDATRYTQFLRNVFQNICI